MDLDYVLTDVALEELAVPSVHSLLRDPRDGAIRQVAIGLQERLQVPRPGRDSPAAELPLRDELLTKHRVVPQLVCHLRRRELHRLLVVLTLHEHIEALIRPADDALAVLEVVVWVAESLPLILRIPRVRVRVVAAEVLGWWRAVEDPRGAADKVHYFGSGELLHLGNDLDAGGPVADNGDALAGVVVAVVPLSRVRHMALESIQALNARPRGVD